MAMLTGTLGDRAESAMQILTPSPPAPAEHSEEHRKSPSKKAPVLQTGSAADEDPIVQ
jgi:hypothetical protein